MVVLVMLMESFIFLSPFIDRLVTGAGAKDGSQARVLAQPRHMMPKKKTGCVEVIHTNPPCEPEPNQPVNIKLARLTRSANFRTGHRPYLSARGRG